jgi:hypothetical protein
MVILSTLPHLKITLGFILAQKKDGDFINLSFCDVFEMENRKIKKIISYLMETK